MQCKIYISKKTDSIITTASSCVNFQGSRPIVVSATSIIEQYSFGSYKYSVSDYSSLWEEKQSRYVDQQFPIWPLCLYSQYLPLAVSCNVNKNQIILIKEDENSLNLP